MNANELADEFKEENNDWNEDNLRHWGKQTEAMLRQQQAEMEKLEKENTDLRYLIATKLEQQDGISLKQLLNDSVLRKAQENF